MDDREELEEVFADLQELDSEGRAQVKVLLQMIRASRMMTGEWQAYQVTYWN